MMHRSKILLTLMLSLAFLSLSCGPNQESPPASVSPSPEQTSGSALPEEGSIRGPSCPESFEEQEEIKEQTQLEVQGTLKLTLGRTPSIPCSWNALEIKDPSVIKKSDRQTKWPAEGSTPQPGAPGVMIYQLRALEPGNTTLTLPCTCLDEEGSENQLEGTYLLAVSVGEK